LADIQAKKATATIYCSEKTTATFVLPKQATGGLGNERQSDIRIPLGRPHCWLL